MGVGRHRPRPVQRENGGDVLELRRGHQPQQAAHGAAVELEDAEGVPAGHQLEGRGVRQWELLQVDVDAAVLPYVDDRVVDDGEVPQAEEVHLQQAHVLALRERETRDDGAVGVPPVDRQDVQQRFGAEDHPGRVHPRAAGEALQPTRGVNDFTDVLVALVEAAHLGGLAVPLVRGVENAGQRNALAEHVRGHRLGDFVAEGVRVAQYPTGVLDRSLRLDRAEGEDLAHPVLAVPLGDITDHVTAATFVEVEVDVRRGDAFGVEEPLEDQPVLDRVEFGDTEDIGDHRPGRRTTPRADPDALLPGVPADVGDNEEVGREAHVGDDADLVLDPVENLLWWIRAEPVLDAAGHLLTQPRKLVLPLRDGEPRHPVDIREDVVVRLDPFGDQQ